MLAEKVSRNISNTNNIQSKTVVFNRLCLFAITLGVHFRKQGNQQTTLSRTSIKENHVQKYSH